jgi:NIPSNAP protein
MKRREFVKAGLVAGAVGPGALVGHSQADRHHYELRIYEMRSDIAPARIRTFFKDQMLPALQRAGAIAAGFFSADIGMIGQSLVVLVDWRSAADALAASDRLDADASFVTAQRAFDRDAPLPYVRYSSQLMRAFAGHRQIEVPPGDASRPARLFEMRTYESRSAEALEKKMAMFNEQEIALFRSIGMTPVFFGENLYGTRLPSLTYMLTFDDLAAREKAWRTFGSHPDWKRISTDPKYAIEGITTVTSAVFLSPLPFSPIR